MRTTRKTVIVLATTAALALTACGAEKSTGTATEDHNAQDVTFAQGMIPHHKGALEMAEEATAKASSPEVKSLAARIEKAQTAEIAKMTAWLKSWDEKVPTSTESMPGMESMEAMPEMNHGSAAEDFDKAFLAMMIEHHKGAVKMATTEKTKGAYAPATAMADDVIRTQNAEITEMTSLLTNS
ncbi:DUF305 domain-containing protein [Streptomyces geranii]|uniref:DUF305 domain-containing protein n=1 Tax=Streptomyces geranii TaxID=2058923 RepID=UPI000D03601C|nr:DUF305 domain-containing protein [Streptomyces geranii]